MWDASFQICRNKSIVKRQKSHGGLFALNLIRARFTQSVPMRALCRYSIFTLSDSWAFAFMMCRLSICLKYSRALFRTQELEPRVLKMCKSSTLYFLIQFCRTIVVYLYFSTYFPQYCQNRFLAHHCDRISGIFMKWFWSWFECCILPSTWSFPAL